MMVLPIRIVLLLLASLLAIPANASDSSTVAPGATVSITGPDGVCRKVTNNNGSNSLYVATTTTAEWENFISNPGSASLATCAPPPPTGFAATGGNQSYIVPAGVTSIQVTLNGAGGGVSSGTGYGGKGGQTIGTLAVTPGETLTVIVGAAGASRAIGTPTGEPATFGGGAAGGNDKSGGQGCASGGGRSAIRRGATELLTAGGGGGGGNYKAMRGDSGGGLTAAASGQDTGEGPHGLDGSQSAGGANGAGGGSPGTQFQGGNGMNYTSKYHCSAGGGGGWFGGGGGGADEQRAVGGGGGSGYCGSASGCTSTAAAGAQPATAGSVTITPQ